MLGGGFGNLRAALRRAAELAETDAEVRGAVASAADIAFLRDSGPLSIQLLSRACERYADRPCLGTRAVDGLAASRSAEPPGAQPSFRMTTYGDLWSRVTAFASGGRAAGLLAAGERVGICGSGSVEWVVADLACLYTGAVSVPLPTAAPRELEQILRETSVSCVVCAEAQLPVVHEALDRCPTVRTVVVMSPGTEAAPSPRVSPAESTADRSGKSLVTMDALESNGRGRGATPVATPRTGESTFSIVYTSGTTGSPKGVVLPETRWAMTLRDAIARKPLPQITVGYLPMHHMAARINVYKTMMLGGATRFAAKSDMSTLLDDIRVARPTSLTLIPRLSAMVHQHFQTQFVQRGGRSRDSTAMLHDPIGVGILAEMRRSFFGDRLCFVSTGAAPTAPELADFLERCFDVHVVDAYGSTELGSVAINGRVQPWVQYKLVDVPDLGYTTADRPYPRGELAVKSERETPGYFNEPAATARLRDADGYVLSGDIVEERGPGHIAWIDRKHSVLRLARGEFVDTPRLEALFVRKSPFIDQMHLHGSSGRAYLVAVIVPSRDAVASELRATAAGHADPQGAIRTLMRAEIDRVARVAGLAGHEIPRDFLIEERPFTPDNDLLTELGKPKRARLQAEFGARLDALCSNVDRRQLRAPGDLAGPTVAATALNAIAGTLGVDLRDIDGARDNFVRLGGDSFNAVRLRDLLAEACGVSMPIATLLDPAISLSTLLGRVEELARDAEAAATFETIHGPGAAWVRAEDVRIDRFVPEDLIGRARPPQAERAPRTFLLTGANGFLGRFLLLELLQRVSDGEGCVVCLVRAETDDAAGRRVQASFRSGEDELLRRFEALSADGRLVVHAGDLTRATLGLPAATYRELSGQVDVIVHNGALVNHALCYADLFDSNVRGTAGVARFALEAQLKPIHFVSTSAVVVGTRERPPLTEEMGAARLWPMRPVQSGSEPVLGYATSKWAGEILLRDLHERCAVPLTISRCGMILPHSRYPGQANHGDTFSRLIYGLVRTGVAPVSFYDDEVGAERHFDGLPVDLVAQFIAALAAREQPTFETYHVSNSNWQDGVSMDTIVDWVATAGYRLERLPYAEWYVEFSRRLELLGTGEKDRSPLPILNRWRRPVGSKSLLKLDTSLFRRRLLELTDHHDISSLTEPYVRHCAQSIAGRPDESNGC